MHTILTLFAYFITYSIIGYIAEITFCTIYTNKLVYNRGFLMGPYIPIYGVGAIILTLTLQRYQSDTLVLFIMSAVYCSILEYITSYIMEKIFNLRWWDYSDKKYNLAGRICLENAILFGLGGVLILKVTNPIVLHFIYNNFSPLFYAINLVLLFIFLLDLAVTCRVMAGVKVNLGKIERKDSTEQIKVEVNKFIQNYGFITNRLFKAFPDMYKYNSQAFDKLRDNILKRNRKR